MHLSLESNRNYFCKSFVLGDRIGQGSMGTVYKARRFGASTPASQSPSYAVKRLDRENMSADQEQRIRAEVLSRFFWERGFQWIGALMGPGV